MFLGPVGLRLGVNETVTLSVSHLVILYIATLQYKYKIVYLQHGTKQFLANRYKRLGTNNQHAVYVIHYNIFCACTFE